MPHCNVFSSCQTDKKPNKAIRLWLHLGTLVNVVLPPLKRNHYNVHLEMVIKKQLDPHKLT